MKKVLVIVASLILMVGTATPADAHQRKRHRSTALMSTNVWDRLAVCESGNTNNGGAPYYGYWQFDARTWRGMGQTGLPNQFSREHQLEVAKKLQAKRGWNPWPGCANKLGLPRRRR